MTDVTKILNDIENGDASFDQLVPVIYDELRSVAQAMMRKERAGHTLDGTALVNEAFLRLGKNPTFESRRHFFGAAAEAMRRILIDHARRRDAEKRGGNMDRVDITIDRLAKDWQSDGQEAAETLHALDKAITRFEALDPSKAELVKLRYFAGLKIHEAAEVLGISTATADRYWAYAKAWLQTELQ